MGGIIGHLPSLIKFCPDVRFIPRGEWSPGAIKGSGRRHSILLSGLGG